MSQTSERPPPSRERDDPVISSCSEGIDSSETSRIERPAQPGKRNSAEFDAEFALALTAAGWRTTALLLTLAAKCIEAGDFLSTERNRQRAREQFIEANDAFRQFQKARGAAADGIVAEAFR